VTSRDDRWPGVAPRIPGHRHKGVKLLGKADFDFVHFEARLFFNLAKIVL
jgi:hypothetical protein